MKRSFFLYQLSTKHFREIKDYKLSFKEKKVTYLKVKINEVNRIPAFHNGAVGKPGVLKDNQSQIMASVKERWQDG